MHHLDTSCIDGSPDNCEPLDRSIVKPSDFKSTHMIRATFDAHAFTLENTEEIQNLTRGCLEPFIFASESDPVLVGSINNGDWKDSIKEGQYILNNRYGFLAIVDVAAVITPLFKED